LDKILSFEAQRSALMLLTHSLLTLRFVGIAHWGLSTACVRISHSCQILSVDGACVSLVTFVGPTPVKTILKLFRPAGCIQGPPKNWPHSTGRPMKTWSRTVT